jgi:hypothetical protein
MAAHAWTAFTLHWNIPGSTAVLMSSTAAIRIVVLVSPTSAIN